MFLFFLSFLLSRWLEVRGARSGGHVSNIHREYAEANEREKERVKKENFRKVELRSPRSREKKERRERGKIKRIACTGRYCVVGQFNSLWKWTKGRK